MIACAKYDSTVQPLENFGNALVSGESEVAQVPDSIVHVDDAVPVLDQTVVHLVNISKVATLDRLILDYVFVIEMRITCKMYHLVVFQRVQRSQPKPAPSPVPAATPTIVGSQMYSSDSIDLLYHTESSV